MQEMQQLMDPSRNMSKYRNMLTAHIAHPPVVSAPHLHLSTQVSKTEISQSANGIAWLSVWESLYAIACCVHMLISCIDLMELLHKNIFL